MCIRDSNTAYDNQHNSPQYGIRNQIDYGTDFGEEADNNQHSAGNRNNIAAGNTGNSNDAETVAIGSIGKGVKYCLLYTSIPAFFQGVFDRYRKGALCRAAQQAGLSNDHEL